MTTRTIYAADAHCRYQGPSNAGENDKSLTYIIIEHRVGYRMPSREATA